MMMIIIIIIIIRKEKEKMEKRETRICMTLNPSCALTNPKS